MTLLDAVALVLDEHAAPLNYREITRRILEGKLWRTVGKTPWATVNARGGDDIRNQGSRSRFERVGKGLIALRIWTPPESVVNDLPSQPAAAARGNQGRVGETLSFTDAAERVLEQSGNREPLHYQGITNRMLELGLVATRGQTPEDTLYAGIHREIARATRRGDTPRFVWYGKGLVGLSRWI